MKIMRYGIILIAMLHSLSVQSQVIDRNYDCSKGHYPTSVNLRFESIKLISALQLLAGFSCNEIVVSDVPDVYIKTAYTEARWDRVVRKICESNGLACWTEARTLYVRQANLNK